MPGHRKRDLGWLVLLCLALPAAAVAEEEPPMADQEVDVLEGHSYHGEAFNEGPRQSAYLMDGLGRVQFPVTTSNALAQKFIAQGVAQLHGFWYFEAERSFRQAAAIDPDCAMSYWGMALANQNNAERGKGFIAEATQRKETATRREQLYIEALDAYLNADSKKSKQRGQQYAKALEQLLYEFPDDIEARAFLALQLWKNRSSDSPINSYLAVDALLEQVFEAEAMHPAHHYRIHLWDSEKPEKALASAARCGQSLPAIAHMWHMPGHIFSKLKRYDDAAWQQEASARVDHAHMMRDRVMPDQIQNFAHNNEWLIRNLNHVGRVRDAIDLAKNMVELPRHPRYNTLSKRGSAYYGRLRLFETLSQFELWEEMIALCQTPYLEPTGDVREQGKRLRHLGRAYWRLDDLENGRAQIAALETLLDERRCARDAAAAEAESKAQEEATDQKQIDEAVAAAAAKAKEEGQDEAGIAAAEAAAREQTRAEQLEAKKQDIEKAVDSARRPYNTPIKELEKALDELRGLEAAAAGEAEKGLEPLRKAGGVDPMFLAKLQLDAGQTDEALKAARRHVDRNRNEVQPLAMLAQLLWQAQRGDEARETFEQLRQLSGSVDLQSPVFTRLAPLAEQFGYPPDWRLQVPPADDLGVRPSLDALGPFRWQPSPAPDWTLVDISDNPRSLKEYQGRPLVLIFYLGHGCLHCAEQLQAFAPQREAFLAAGLDMLAISSDSQTDLQLSLASYAPGLLPIPLVSNAELDVFQAYRVYDDFEQQPLHGTFLIDADGMIRWQDISYEPFMEPDFLLEEAQRLLTQDEAS